MAQPSELANLSLTMARHELTEMRTRLIDAAGGDREVVRRAVDIVKSTDTGRGTVADPRDLALELLSATLQQITERNQARR